MRHALAILAVLLLASAAHAQVRVAPGQTGVMADVYITDANGYPALGLTAETVRCYYHRSTAAGVQQVPLTAGATLGTYLSLHDANGAFVEANQTFTPGLYQLQAPNNAFAAGPAEVTFHITSLDANAAKTMGVGIIVNPSLVKFVIEANTAGIQAKLGGRDANLAYVEGWLSAHDANVGNLQARQLADEANVAGLQAKLAGFDSNFSTLEARQLARDSNFAGIQNKLAASDANRATVEALLLIADANVAGVQSKLAARDANVSYIEAWLATHDANWASVEIGIRAKDANLRDIGALALLPMKATSEANLATQIRLKDANGLSTEVDAHSAAAGSDANITAGAVWNMTMAEHTTAGSTGATLSALSAGSGTGAWTVYRQVLDSNRVKLQNATVRYTLNNTTCTGTSDSNGLAKLNVDTGTWTVAATLSGYTYAGGTHAVSADSNTDLTMTATAIPVATIPGTCAVYFDVYDKDFALKSGVAFTFTMTKLPTGSGEALPGVGQTGTSNASGRVSVTLRRGATYKIGYGTTTVRDPLIVPDAASYLGPTIKY